MSDNERLEEIKNNYSVGIHILSGKHSVAITKENFEWLIEQAEKVEQVQTKIERYEKALKEIIEGEGVRLNFIGESNSEALEIAKQALEGDEI